MNWIHLRDDDDEEEEGERRGSGSDGEGKPLRASPTPISARRSKIQESPHQILRRWLTAMWTHPRIGSRSSDSVKWVGR